MKTKKRLTKKQLRLKKQAEKKSNRILILVGLGLVLMIVASWGYQYHREYKNKNAYKKYIGLEVPKEKLCMRGDLVKQNATFHVDVGEKTYQVCCNMCKNKIKGSSKYRLAIDPLSKELIDKSESYVVLDPDQDGKVLYFESEISYQDFIKLDSK